MSQQRDFCLIENAICIRETDKAILVAVENTQHWIPKSQINYDESEVTKLGDEGYLVVASWIAKEKGW